MDVNDCLNYCKQAWSEGGSALEGLKALIRIPNLSPDYDPEFLTNGLIHKAVDTVKAWIESQQISGLQTHVYNDEGRQPLLRVNIPGTSPEAPPILCYGHLDKMPHLDPARWSEGLSATNPVVRNGKLYGRGTNDDGYNSFLLLTAIKYLQEHNLKYPKVTILLETGEESGDVEIKRYLDELHESIGECSTICVLDAEAQDYKTVWCCVSLRGVINGVLSVEHLATPCHSGMATGLVPSTFRIARQLISRIEDEKTGEILLKEAHVPEIPKNRIDQCYQIAAHIGDACHAIVSPLQGCKLVTEDNGQLLVNKAWIPGLAVTGCDGIPSIQNGSNVMRPKTALKLSLRIPPGVDAEKTAQALKETLEKDPPYGAKVSYTPVAAGNGWWGRDFDEKTDAALKKATKEVFGQDPLYYGEGGSIPLCNKFNELWPKAQIFVTGCAGVDSNPHGFDESLDIPYTTKFTALVAALFHGIA
ncbi:Clan MH, family M20, peptidase T-like metallopeptidase [Tritrichomonas foetus]|uniref:Clan MH, family M20, peptidase T-like metallopeptidase n=1 Tax=Tritrichomonas foetus TaxID=1144522 RepID=A0A1J4J6T6_9EUKA|nr:Clan MH, family M20, peptidase T-like metallopeptidase [Tritrichomonas foetus]|eukprot:OHS94950.1 Clan MH, family M20, peptidase T-like metallopeptidase [Tritrichomonas foetus]